MAELERKRTKGEKVFMIVMFAFFALYSFVMIYSFFYIFFNALKTNSEFFEHRNALPQAWLFSNFIDMFQKIEYNSTNFSGMFGNSILLTLECSIAAILFPTITAYVLSKYKFKFCKFLYSLAIVIQTIPTIGSLTAQYQLVYAIGINDNYSLIWLLSAGSLTFNMIIIYAGFESISWTYAQAAQMDGAGHFRIFFSIMLPLAKPFIIANFVTTFINKWNDYMTPFLYMDRYPTVALGLYQFQQKQTFATDMPPLFAGIVVSILPVLILFACMQKSIISNTVAGGLKG